MTNIEMIEFIDEFLSKQEDVLHGIEGRDCTKSRKYLDMIKKQLTLTDVVKSLKDKYTNEFWFWLERFESEDDSNRLWWYKKDVMLSTEEMWQEYNRLKTTL